MRAPMNRRPGASLRAVRIRRGWRQEDLVRRARVSRATVSRIERGLLDGVSFGALVRTADALDVRLEIVVHWRGGDLDRLLDAGHAALRERGGARPGGLPGGGDHGALLRGAFPADGHALRSWL